MGQLLVITKEIWLGFDLQSSLLFLQMKLLKLIGTGAESTAIN